MLTFTDCCNNERLQTNSGKLLRSNNKSERLTYGNGSKLWRNITHTIRLRSRNKSETSTLNKLKNNSLILYGTELISSKHFIFKLKNSSKIILKKN
jgi:hypothetical protein